MPRLPDPDETLRDLYKNLPQEELLRQGRQRLGNDAAERARRAARMGRVVMWSCILGAALLGAGFICWLLLMAKRTGSSFGEMKNEAMKAYIDPDS